MWHCTALKLVESSEQTVICAFAEQTPQSQFIANSCLYTGLRFMDARLVCSKWFFRTFRCSAPFVNPPWPGKQVVPIHAEKGDQMEVLCPCRDAHRSNFAFLVRETKLRNISKMYLSEFSLGSPSSLQKATKCIKSINFVFSGRNRRYAGPTSFCITWTVCCNTKKTLLDPTNPRSRDQGQRKYIRETGFSAAKTKRSYIRHCQIHFCTFLWEFDFYILDAILSFAIKLVSRMHVMWMYNGTKWSCEKKACAVRFFPRHAQGKCAFINFCWTWTDTSKNVRPSVQKIKWNGETTQKSPLQHSRG